MNTKLLFFLCLAPLLMACKGSQSSGDAPAIDSALVCKVQFDADSAFHFVKAQCDFGARTSNFTAIERCGDYIVAKFRSYGLDITEPKTASSLRPTTTPAPGPTKIPTPRSTACRSWRPTMAHRAWR